MRIDSKVVAYVGYEHCHKQYMRVGKISIQKY